MNATVKHDGFHFLVRSEAESGHTLPVRLPWLRNELALAGDEVVALSRRYVVAPLVSVADWVGRNAVLVVVAFLVALFTGGLAAGLSGLGAHFAAVMVAMCGGALSVGLVAYRAGDPDA